jgi:ParB family chromosome partitioning protein
METARAFRQLIRRFELTQSEVASRIGMPRSTVANFLRLLELPETVQSLLDEGRLTMGHGRALAALDDARTKVRLAQAAAKAGWSVRRIEREVRRRLEQSTAGPAEKGSRRKDPNVLAAEETLSRSLAARVQIEQRSSGQGRIEIRFADGDDLDRIYRALLRAGGAGAA